MAHSVAWGHEVHTRSSLNHRSACIQNQENSLWSIVKDEYETMWREEQKFLQISS